MKTFLNDLVSDARASLATAKVAAVVTAFDSDDILAMVARDYYPWHKPVTKQQVAEWLEKHADALEEAMYYGARDYIREHWPCPTCGLIRKTFGCYDACGHPDRVAERG
jgi:hypothetical protein